MSKPVLKLASLAALVFVALPVAAQEPAAASGSQTAAVASFDRLFLNFAEDTALAERQWWEAQLDLQNGDVVDITGVRGVVAFQPWKKIEVGGRVGFASSDTPFGLPDGSGATDLDAWIKYHLGASGGTTDFAVGGMITVPTGDDTAGLGFDAFSASVFGALRHKLRRGVLAVNAGFRMNGDGQILGLPEFDGEVAPMAGAGWILPLREELSLITEIDFEGERFDGLDSDVRLLGGVNWRVRNRGMIRAAFAVGMSDGAPDAQVLAGYAAAF